MLPVNGRVHLRALRDRLIETIRSLDSRDSYRLLLYEGRIDPTQIVAAPEELAAAIALLDPHDHLNPRTRLEAGEAERLQPWIDSLRRGLAPLLDLLHALQKGRRS